MTLSDVPSRTTVVIASSTAPAAERRRLVELGLRQGARVEVLRRAPFGGPLAVRVGGVLLALRSSHAGHLLVEPEPADG